MSTALIPMGELLPSQGTWDTMKRQGAELLKSGFLPASIKTPEQFIAIVLKGRELGLPPMYACNHIVVIQGKPTMSAEVQLAMIFKHCPTAKINYLEVSNDRCVVKASRDGANFSQFSFTMEDAKAANLTSKENWRKYPRAMLRSRCVSELARSLFPDCLAGVSYTPEELGAVVDESGDIIDIPQEAVAVNKVVATPEEFKQVEAAKHHYKSANGYDPAISTQAQWFWEQVIKHGIDPARVIEQEFVGMPGGEILAHFKKLAGANGHDSQKRV